MNMNNEIIVALDIGSCKICCMIARNKADDICKVVGVGYNESRGINSGIITDFFLASKSILNSIRSAEKQSGIKIKNGISVSISSSKTETNLFKSKVKIKDKKVTKVDISECLSQLLKRDFFSHKKVIYASPISFSLDQASGIKNPLGMYGNEIEIDFIISYIGYSHYRNYIECINQCGLDVNKIIVSSTAAGYAVLNENELILGAAVVDMGSKTTSLAIFSDNNFIFSKVLNYGGNNITEALARRFGITMEEAEKLKVMHSSLLESNDDQEVFLEIPSINSDNSDDYIQITRREVLEVIKPITTNLLGWVQDELNKSGHSNSIGKVMVFTGGAAQIDGLLVLAKDIIGYNLRIGIPKELRFNFFYNIDSSYAVVAGLLNQEIYFKEREEKNYLKNKNLSDHKLSFSNIKSWLAENFF